MTPQYAPDPGGQFASDTHRRVLGHLSSPEDDYGWSNSSLVARMIPDVGTDITDTAEIDDVLNDLEADGHAENQDGIWRMTQSGFDLLTGPIADEPSLGEESAPAAVDTNGAAGGASPLPAAHKKKGGK
jgi:hypothetical protein